VDQDRDRFDIEFLDDDDPFEFEDDWQRFHLVKHAMLDSDDVREVWASDPLFYPAHPDGKADWLMVAEVAGGEVLVVPLARGSTPQKASPCGLYPAPPWLERRYLRDR
jgi:hypothetical protein